VLVNSAANFVKQPFDEVTVDDWKTVMQVNLRARSSARSTPPA
jgi:NAD(P)-dependent dehydrogenase (short-subunit alcohol dehydrogenase family)